MVECNLPAHGIVQDAPVKIRADVVFGIVDQQRHTVVVQGSLWVGSENDGIYQQFPV